MRHDSTLPTLGHCGRHPCARHLSVRRDELGQRDFPHPSRGHSHPRTLSKRAHPHCTLVRAFAELHQSRSSVRRPEVPRTNTDQRSIGILLLFARADAVAIQHVAVRILYAQGLKYGASHEAGSRPRKDAASRNGHVSPPQDGSTGVVDRGQEVGRQRAFGRPAQNAQGPTQANLTATHPTKKARARARAFLFFSKEIAYFFFSSVFALSG